MLARSSYRSLVIPVEHIIMYEKSMVSHILGKRGVVYGTVQSFKTPNGKWVRVKQPWGIYILNFFKRDLFVFLSEKFRGLNDVQ